MPSSDGFIPSNAARNPGPEDEKNPDDSAPSGKDEISGTEEVDSAEAFVSVVLELEGRGTK
jgi:hypothetical protein